MLACGSLLGVANATTVFTEDFSSSSLPSIQQGNVGFFNGNVNFDQIVVASTEASIVNGVLEVTTTNSFRGIGILIDPASFSGAGEYNLSFDIIDFDPGADFAGTPGPGFAEASVFSGTGFDGGDNADSLNLSSTTGQLTSTGTATAGLLATQQFTASGTDLNLSFTHDGTSAVAIFLGANTSAFPFPTVQFDNIEVSAVPEPSSLLFVMSSALCVFIRRRA